MHLQACKNRVGMSMKRAIALPSKDSVFCLDYRSVLYYVRDVVEASVDLAVRWICSRIQRKSFKTSEMSLLPVEIVAYLVP